MKMIALAGVLLFAASILRAEVKMETITYDAGGAVLKSVLVYDTNVSGKAPGVVIFPEWWGLTDYPRSRAQMLVKLGYVVLAADMYGQGQSTDDPKEAGKLSGAVYANPEALLARAKAAVSALRNSNRADPQRLAAIGYCFGGSIALQLARSNEPIKAVVAFHAGLASHGADSNDPIVPSILVCNGGDDKFISAEEYARFYEEMRRRKADWALTLYGGALHAFTNPAADRHKDLGIGYNAIADKRSWDAMRQFLADALTP